MRPSAIFHAHPASVGETYRQHFLVAIGFAGRLAAAAAAAGIHAVVPSLCTTSASRRVAELDEAMSSGARAPAAETLSSGAVGDLVAGPSAA